METIIRLGFLGAIIAFLGICYTGIQRVTSYDPGGPVYSAPHVVPAYADTDGDGFVPAAGDPLYDEHYAEQVNLPNSEALQGLNQIPVLAAEANLINAEAARVRAEAEQIEQETKAGKFGAIVTLVIVGAVILLILAAIFR